MRTTGHFPKNTVYYSREGEYYSELSSMSSGHFLENTVYYNRGGEYHLFM